MKSIYDIRRENLSEIINRDFDANQTRLAERLGIQQNLVSRWETGAKNIGSNAARRIEETARRPAYWLDFDHQLIPSEPVQEDSAAAPSAVGAIAAANLRRWMQQSGEMSQQQVADASGVSQATINRFLRNEASITLNNLAAIAEAFNKCPYEMLQPPGALEYDIGSYAALPPGEKEKIQSFIEFIIAQNTIK